MSRNEIRLRRHRMTASGADRFRNYSDVLHRHERDVRAKKIMRAFIMFMVVMMLMTLLYFVTRIEKQKQEPSNPQPTHSSAYAPDLSKTP